MENVKDNDRGRDVYSVNNTQTPKVDKMVGGSNGVSKYFGVNWWSINDGRSVGVD